MPRNQSTHLLSAFKTYSGLSLFRGLAIEECTIPLSPHHTRFPLIRQLNIHPNVLKIAITHALQFSITGDLDATFSPLRRNAEKYGNTYILNMIALHIDRITDLRVLSIREIIFLAYIQHALTMNSKHLTKRYLSENTQCLPNLDKCHILSAIIENMVNRMLHNTQQLIINPSLEGAYSERITNGTVDFMTDDTLYVIQLSPPRFFSINHIPLAATWLMLPNTPTYKNTKILNLSIINPFHYTYSKVPVTNINRGMIAQLHEFIYPTIKQYQLNLPVPEQNK